MLFLGPSYCCHVDLWHVWDYLVFHLFQVRRALPRHGWGATELTCPSWWYVEPRPWFRWIWECCSWPLCKWSGAWDFPVCTWKSCHFLGPKSQTPRNPNNQKLKYIPGPTFQAHKNSGSVKGLAHDLPLNPPRMILNTPSFWRSIIRAHLRSWMNLLGALKISLHLSFHLVQKWWKPSRWKWKKWKGGVGWKSKSWTTFWGGIFLCPAVSSRSKSRRCRWSQGIRRQPPCTSVCVLKIRFLVLSSGFWWFLDVFFQTDFVGMDFWDEFGMEFMKWYKWSLGCFRQIYFVSFLVMNIMAFSRKRRFFLGGN